MMCFWVVMTIIKWESGACWRNCGQNWKFRHVARMRRNETARGGMQSLTHLHRRSEERSAWDGGGFRSFSVWRKLLPGLSYVVEVAGSFSGCSRGKGGFTRRNSLLLLAGFLEMCRIFGDIAREGLVS